MHLDDIRHMAEAAIAEHKLDGWVFTFDRAEKRLGYCRFDTRTISMSRSFAAVAAEEDVVDTILHEIAHALVGPAHGHDATWKQVAVSIGSSGAVRGFHPRDDIAGAEARARTLSAAGLILGGVAAAPRAHGRYRATAKPGTRVITFHGQLAHVAAVGRTRYNLLSEADGQNYVLAFEHTYFVQPVTEPSTSSSRTAERASFPRGASVKVDKPGAQFHGWVGKVQEDGPATVSVAFADRVMRIPARHLTAA